MATKNVSKPRQGMCVYNLNPPISQVEGDSFIYLT